MREYLDIDGLKFEVIRSHRRKTIGVKVTKSGDLIIQAPSTLSEDEISPRVRGKLQWVRRKLKLVNQKVSDARKFTLNDETIPYMGRVYRIAKSSRIKVGLFQGRIHVPESSNHEPREELLKWYKSRAKSVLKSEFEYISDIFDNRAGNLRILDLGSRWGSCSMDGNINLNWKLITLPRTCREYVIYHELAHLEVHSHSKEYWKHLGIFLPDWEKRKQELEQAELKFNLQTE